MGLPSAQVILAITLISFSAVLILRFFFAQPSGPAHVPPDRARNPGRHDLDRPATNMRTASMWPVLFGLLVVALAVIGATLWLSLELRQAASVGRFVPINRGQLILVDSRTGAAYTPAPTPAAPEDRSRVVARLDPQEAQRHADQEPRPNVQVWQPFISEVKLDTVDRRPPWRRRLEDWLGGDATRSGR